MTHAALAPLIGPEFDAFLGAVVGEDKNEKAISVLSALARLNVDPWQEVAKLATMPRAVAIEHLAALIGALPDAPSLNRPVGVIAADLIALLPSLPQAVLAKTFAKRGQPQAGRDGNNAAALFVAGLIVVFLALLAYRGAELAAPALSHADGAAAISAPKDSP